mmetsp:Transcript_4139/g.3464  ORF Transcript_4139/g.3464 Transcript_4139/m.3464 type:complete len:508 (+) Transcript_4139:259-1782(+)
MSLFSKGELKHKGSSIPVVRLDIQKHADMLKDSGIELDFVPRIYVYFNKKYYLYNEEDNLNLLVNFINKIIHPVAELNNDKQVENFINTASEVIESTDFYNVKYRSIRDKFEKLTKVTRVLGIFNNTEEHADKIKEFKNVARELSERTDLRVGIVTDPELVKNYKTTMGPHWFNDTSSNSIVIFREKPEENQRQRFYDIEGDDYNLKTWISFSSLDDVERLTQYSARIMQELSMPIFIALLPENHLEDEASIELMKGLRTCAYIFPEVLLSFTNDTDDLYLREHMTIIWKELPSLGLLTNEGMLPVNFPRNQPFTQDNLNSFFGHFMNGTIHTEKFDLPNLNLDFGLSMPHAHKIDTTESDTSINGVDKILKDEPGNERDTILLIYDSSKKFYQINLATFIIELTAYLFEDTEVKTLNFAYLDVNNGTIPEAFENKRIIPHFQFLPAGEKARGDFKTDTITDIQSFLMFVKNNAKTDLSKALGPLGLTDEPEAPQQSIDEEGRHSDL